MVDWDDLQRRTHAVIPDRELKPKRCWIGVLTHMKDPEEEFQETDFIWMLGHSKITIHTVYETYQKRHHVAGLQLKHKGDFIDLRDTIGSFQTPGNILVLFLACQPSKDQTPAQFLTGLQLDRRDSELQAEITSQPQTSLASDLAALSIPPHTYGTSEAWMPALPAPNTTANSTFVHREIDPSRAVLLPPNPMNRCHQMEQPSDRFTTTYPRQSFGVPTYQSPYANIQGQLNEDLVFPWTSSFTNPTAPHPYQTGHVNPDIAPHPYQTGHVNPNIAPHPYQTGHVNPNIAPAQNQTAMMEGHHWPPSYTGSLLDQHVKEEESPSFDADEFFGRHPSPDSQEVTGEVTTVSQQHIRAIVDQQDPLLLEAGVEKSIMVLKTLKDKFSQHAATNLEAQSWMQAIEKLIPQAERKRTVVGVVGNTGAGKSSVINALLDEERLVPTNCMRACTAVVTEISWNTSTSTAKKYRAEIEFIAHADWEKELHTLMKEFLTENGTLSRDISDPNSDAGIAWAKFHAVYPDIARDSLGDCTVPDLMAKPAIAKTLGATRTIAAAVPERFYQELQSYVDSKEKVTKKSKDKAKEKKTRSKMEYWPLIKVVKIYTKSPALSTGACIVDLPGVHDANAARAAVAQGYMKQCTGLWIVAPINRAVDDKAAKTLLGDSFKRQLKYDGGFSSITFICSKTDDISITEAIDSLELEDDIADFEREQAQYTGRIEKIERDISQEQANYKVALSNVMDEIEKWETLEDSLNDGKTVYAPLPTSKKRKRGNFGHQSRKKSLYEDSDYDLLITDDENEDEEESTTGITRRTPLSEADIKQKLKELREVKKEARRVAIDKKAGIDILKSQIRDLNLKIDEIKAKISRLCIAGRNQYSKTAIQADFAAGIKEIDQENAADEDEDGFDPDEETRDYDQVAKSLPVFCVSSRAYQKMQGRLIKDDGVPGFMIPEETEIPQLQAHCKKLTVSGRVQTARTFLLNLCQLLTTFHLWASDDGTGLEMTGEDKAKQVSYLKRRLEELETGLEQAVHACIDEMRTELKNQIFDKFPELINAAINAAPTTAVAWGEREMGGLLWSTYKAVVRRNGVYHSSSAGHRDFNADLVDPIVKKLATGWERAFQNRLPRAFNTYIQNSSKVLHAFHTAVENRACKTGVGLASLTVLKTQIFTYEQLYTNLGTLLVTQMNELQREANRDFTPTIANIMHAVYDACTIEHGPGSYKRMKEHMLNHVERERYTMFHDATRTVEKNLDQMCKSLQESMEAKADEIFVQMHRDYMHVLAGREIKDSIMLQERGESRLRKEMRELLGSVDKQFEGIANGELGIKASGEEETESVISEYNNASDDQEDFFSVEDDDDDHDSVMNSGDDTGDDH